MDKDLKRMNVKHRKFCKYYLDGLSPGDAYRKAGYSGKGSENSASALLKNPRIIKYIDKIRKLSDKELGINRAFVLRKYKEIMDNPESQQILCTALRDFSKIEGYEKKEKEQPQVLIQINSETLEDKIKLLRSAKTKGVTTDE